MKDVARVAINELTLKYVTTSALKPPIKIPIVIPPIRQSITLPVAFSMLKANKGATTKIEDIEILRFFEMGIKIKMVKVSNSAVAVDEPADKVKVEKILNEKKR